MRLIDFCRRAWPHAWKISWHHELVCENLELLDRGDIPNLAVCAPPRHAKSRIISVDYPAYSLLHDPHAKFIYASHSGELSRSAARAARDLTLSPSCQAQMPLKLKVAGDSKWMVDFSGSNQRYSYIGCSIEGGLTGEGCTRLIADDLLKGAQEAWSEGMRSKIWQIYEMNAETRLAPDGRQVLVSTRWHLDDVCGRVIRRAMENPQASQWRVLVLAATNDDGQQSYILDTWKPKAEASTCLPAYTALWPGQFSRKALDEKRANLLPSHWAALYQQNPLTAEDQLFPPECWSTLDSIPVSELEYVISGWDTASKTGNEHDYSANVMVGRLRSGHLVVLDCWQDKLDFARLLPIVYERWARATATLGCAVILAIEDANAGRQLIDLLKAHHPEVPLLEMKAVQSKPLRAEAAAVYSRAGSVYLPSSASWRDRFITELAQFPLGSTHDDIPDAYVHAVRGFFVQRDFHKPGFVMEMPLTDEDVAAALQEEWEYRRATSINPELDEWEARRGIW